VPGTGKPSYNAYAMPIWIRSTGPASSPQLELWTQARFRAGAVTPSDVAIFQFQPQGSSTWTSITPLEPLNPAGFVDVRVPENAYGVPGTWRAIWVGPTGFFISRDVPFPS
jgi:hypothetical protein